MKFLSILKETNLIISRHACNVSKLDPIPFQNVNIRQLCPLYQAKCQHTCNTRTQVRFLGQLISFVSGVGILGSIPLSRHFSFAIRLEEEPPHVPNPGLGFLHFKPQGPILWNILCTIFSILVVDYLAAKGIRVVMK